MRACWRPTDGLPSPRAMHRAMPPVVLDPVVVLFVIEEPQRAPRPDVHGSYAGCFTHPEESGKGDDGKTQAEPVEGGPDVPGHEPEGDQLGPHLGWSWRGSGGRGASCHEPVYGPHCGWYAAQLLCQAEGGYDASQCPRLLAHGGAPDEVPGQCPRCVQLGPVRREPAHIPEDRGPTLHGTRGPPPDGQREGLLHVIAPP